MLTALKLTATGILVLSSFIIALVKNGGTQWLVVAALVCSWFGDAAMAYWKPFGKFITNYDLFGVASFALAQAFYSAAFVARLKGVSAGAASPLITLALFEIVGIVMWVVLAGMTNIERPLKLATLVYVVLLVGMASLSVSAARTDISRLWPIMAGGLLFVISDGLIAVNWFMKAGTNVLPYFIWGTYIPAQTLLLIGFSLIPEVSAAASNTIPL